MPAVISAASGLLGAVVGGGATYLTQRADRTDRGRGELRAALVGFGYALDALHLQISRLPRTTRVAVLSERLVNPQRTPALHYLVDWAHRATLGRDTYRALDQFTTAYNRLLLVSPEELLVVCEPLATLIAHADQHDQHWQDEWTEARGELTRVSRQLLANH
ncbi:MAG: hypothetical protein QOI62_1486 [Solirubrobacteraceae bacterium]|jgi:hypothetical protein|nr:hypothetical protein [Solirubrobacteraceae bacterium]